ncbi:hypothetical protein [Micromonospora sp. CA-111912]|uniref:hypothetical protein n=1 Tax=Micromonospora sp. CA-111912 TaxID=3239955 RepID=UPI003D9065E2
MFVKSVITVLLIIAGLAAIIWVANWPFNTPWEKDLDAEQRRINVAHNRRHHRGAARLVLPIFAIVLGITSASLLAGPKADRFAALIMGICSAVCLGVFGALIKSDRRRRSSTRR